MAKNEWLLFPPNITTECLPRKTILVANTIRTPILFPQRQPLPALSNTYFKLYFSHNY